MIVGALGDVTFEVTEKTIRTVSEMTWSGAARWAVHERHGNNALEEYTGIDPDTISMTVYLSKSLGVDPMEIIAKVLTYERDGTPLSLVLGDHAYGKYKWVIRANSTEMGAHTRDGRLYEARMKLDLMEYMNY